MDLDQWEQNADKLQNVFRAHHSQGKTYSRDHIEFIKMGIGLVFFGEPKKADPTRPLEQCYQYYDSNEKKQISFIFDQMMRTLPYAGSFLLNRTMLIVKEGKSEVYLENVLRFSSTEDLKAMYFIDRFGRIYQNWEQFVKTNKLPSSCEYVTVENGVYHPSAKLRKYSGPPVKMAPLLLEGASTAAVVTSLVFPQVSTTMVCLSFVARIGGSAFALSDRKEHGLSIGLDNKESVFHYAGISAAALNGVCTIGVANASQIGNLSARSCKLSVISIQVAASTAVALDALLVALTLHSFWEKWRAGDGNLNDVFLLTYQAFALYGAVLNAQRVHKILSDVRETNMVRNCLNVSNKKLTEDQRNDLQKWNEETRARLSETSADVVRVVEKDEEVSSLIRQMAYDAGAAGIKFLLERNPKAKIIVHELMQIRDLVRAHSGKKISGQTFIYQLSKHLENLYTILEKDLKNMYKFLEKRFRRVPKDHDVAQILNNEMDKIEQAGEDVHLEITETAESTSAESVANSERNNQIQPENQMKVTYHRRMLEAAKNLILKCAIPEDSVLVSFHEAFMFVMDETETYFNYDGLLAKSVGIIGEEMAKDMLRVLGTKTETDFIPNKIKFDKQVGVIGNAVDKFLARNSHIKSKAEASSSSGYEIIVDKLSTLVDGLVNIALADTNQVGLNELTDILRKISGTILGNLIYKFESSKRVRDALIKANLEVLGEECTYEMLKKIGVPISTLDAYRDALTQLDENKNDIVASMLQSCTLNVTSNKNSRPADSEDDAESKPSEMNLGYVKFTAACEKLYLKIDAPDTDDQKTELFKKVILFVGSKIVAEIKGYKNKCEKLKENIIDAVGPVVFNEMLRSIGSDKDKALLVKEFCEKLDADDDLVTEFSEFALNCECDLKKLRAWDNTIADDGFTTYRIHCPRNENDQYYFNRSFKLFKVSLHSSCIVTRAEKFILIESGNISVIFHFVSADSDDTFVILSKG